MINIIYINGKKGKQNSSVDDAKHQMLTVEAIARDLIKYSTKNSAKDMKKTIKSSMPSITLGTQYTPIESVSAAAATSGNVNNALLLTAIAPSKSSDDCRSIVATIKLVTLLLESMGFKCVK